jgi:serine/threonine-protein kinase RsbW
VSTSDLFADFEEGSPGDAEISLTLPVDAGWLSLARTIGASVAARADFTYDEIADLRLAIDELCLSLLERSTPTGRIEILYTLEDETLRVSATISGGSPLDDPDRDVAAREFSERILDALVDDHGSDHLSATPAAWLMKKRSPR